ncbi:MAG: 3-dehydroquinate synthase, partial [Pyrinomonadaceae bacterium]
MQRVHVRLAANDHQYDIRIGRAILGELGSEIAKCMHRQPRRVALISNKKVFDLYGEQTLKGLRAKGFIASRWLMGEGEHHKTLSTLSDALLFLCSAGLERTDAVLALGGGVVGDLAGFAAATYLRGVAFIQVPTSLVAQVDSSVGGKTGVNLPAGKNLVGAFHQPRRVVADVTTLRTLPKRELTAGWCESIKHGAVGKRALFNQTRTFLENIACAPDAFDSPDLEKLIGAHCAFKAAIVAGDEREAVDRSGPRSRRILNFGHTVGHALEAVTQYRRFRHGEAVGHGMLVAGQISKDLGLLAASELESLREAVRLCGPLPKA